MTDSEDKANAIKTLLDFILQLEAIQKARPDRWTQTIVLPLLLACNILKSGDQVLVPAWYSITLEVLTQILNKAKKAPRDTKPYIDTGFSKS
jgi:hypothetical protein